VNIAPRRAPFKSNPCAYPHFRPFNLPFIAVAFVFSPFCLEEVKNAGKREVLAVLGRRRGDITRLLATLLLLLLLLLLLVLRLQVLGLEPLQRPKHGEGNLLWVLEIVGWMRSVMIGQTGRGTEHSCLESTNNFLAPATASSSLSTRRPQQVLVS